MDTETILLVITLFVGFYMAWNIGANDVSNAMGTSVGAGSLTLKRAVILAAVLEFSGAFFVGSNVSETIQSGIVNPEVFSGEPRLLAYGMMAALLAAGVWLQLASFLGWPVSTTHTIVGAVLGFGAIYAGIDAIYWDQIFFIVSSWVVSPLLGAAVAYFVFSLIVKYVFYSRDPLGKAKKIAPILAFWVLLVLGIGLFLKNLAFNRAFSLAAIRVFSFAIVGAIIFRFVISKIQVDSATEKKEGTEDPKVIFGLNKVLKHLHRTSGNASDELRYQLTNISEEVLSIKNRAIEGTAIAPDSQTFAAVEKVFSYLQMVSASCMAFAHGANDVANAIGPLAAAITILKGGVITEGSSVPTWVLVLGGSGIVIGLATWGWRVIETIGKKITELTPSRGFAAELAAASTILLASKMGLPISTTHTLVGAVLGVGLARGIGALNLGTIRDIVISWVVTVPAGAILSIFFFYGLKACFS